MGNSINKFDVFLEIGKKKVFAGAVRWPGWCRFGRDEESAVQKLFDYGPRYARILESSGLGFIPPEDLSYFNIGERVEGNATTDFGGIDAELSNDAEPIGSEEMERFQAVLQACWKAFDAAVRLAEGKELRKGPRGGGRELERIIDHVLVADEGYLKRISWEVRKLENERLDDQLMRIRAEIFEGLETAARGELATVGPRGGKRWTPRFFVRRLTWHVVDHTWEIEDRIE